MPKSEMKQAALRMKAAGVRRSAIAYALGVTVGTVDTYIRLSRAQDPTDEEVGDVPVCFVCHGQCRPEDDGHPSCTGKRVA